MPPGPRGSAHHWWRAPDHFDWLAAYIAERGAARLTANAISAATFGLAILQLLVLFSPQGPHRPVERAAALAISAGCAVFGMLWLRRGWPTLGQSRLFVLFCVGGIAVSALIEGDPRTALLNCGLYGMLGVYVAFFHSGRMLALTIATSVVTTTILSYRIFLTDPALAATKFLVIIGIVIAIPLMCQRLFRQLSRDADHSRRDPLTGLLNRRGFHRRVGELLDHRGHNREPHLILALIDLDRFKQINDTEGHTAGDYALMAVGRALVDTARRDALVARIGGEEFVVADICIDPDCGALGERLRRAVEALPHNLSASVGTIAVRRPNPYMAVTDPMIDALLREADQAMYDAKRAGGNRHRHRDLDLGIAFDEFTQTDRRAS